MTILAKIYFFPAKSILPLRVLPWKKTFFPPSGKNLLTWARYFIYIRQTFLNVYYCTWVQISWPDPTQPMDGPDPSASLAYTS